MEYTKKDFTTPIKGVRQCVNCGAYAKTVIEVKHYATCRAGEAKKWEQYYEEGNKEV